MTTALNDLANDYTANDTGQHMLTEADLRSFAAHRWPADAFTQLATWATHSADLGTAGPMWEGPDPKAGRAKFRQGRILEIAAWLTNHNMNWPSVAATIWLLTADTNRDRSTSTWTDLLAGGEPPHNALTAITRIDTIDAAVRSAMLIAADLDPKDRDDTGAPYSDSTVAALAALRGYRFGPTPH